MNESIKEKDQRISEMKDEMQHLESMIKERDKMIFRFIKGLAMSEDHGPALKELWEDMRLILAIEDRELELIYNCDLSEHGEGVESYCICPECSPHIHK